jgi:hypothetical protein
VYTRSIRVLLQALPSLARWSIIPHDDSRYPFQQALVTSVLQAIRSAGTSLVAWLAWHGGVQPHCAFVHNRLLMERGRACGATAAGNLEPCDVESSEIMDALERYSDALHDERLKHSGSADYMSQVPKPPSHDGVVMILCVVCVCVLCCQWFAR